MMASIGVLLGLAATLLSGYAVGRGMMAGLSKSEAFAWSLAVGLVLQAAVLAACLAVRAGADLTAPVAITTAILLLPLLSRGRSAASEALPVLSRLLLAAAAAGVVLFGVAALSEPMWTTDYLAVWGFKAKTIFLTSSLPARLFHDPETAWSHPEYPLLLPLDLAALAAWARGWDDRALALLDPLLQTATAAALFGFLARRGRAAAGAAAAALCALCAPLYAPAHVGMADIPLALGFVLLASALCDAFESESAGVYGRLATSSLFCAALKPEGALFAVLAAVCWLALRPQARPLAPVLTALVGPPLAHGVLLRIARGAVPARDFDFSLVAPSRWGAWLPRLAETIARIASVEVVAAAIPLAAIALFLMVTRRGPADRLLPVLSAQVLFYAAACSLSAFGVAWLVATSFARITLALAPVLLLVLCSRLEPDAGT
jgi:hypothetical protein